MAVLHKAFSSPPVCCYFISFPNLLDSCDSAVKYSYNDSRKDRLSHFYHLLSVVISSHSPISLTAAIAQSSTATMIAVRIVFPHFYHLPSVVISSHSPISLTAAIAQSSTATMIAVRIVFPIFITSCPLFCIHYTTLSSSTKV